MTAASIAPFTPSTPVGFIGLGVMGRGMARRLMGAGYALTAMTRRPDVADAFKAEGATIAPDAKALGATCPLVFLCLSDAPAVEQVLFAAGGLAAALPQGACVVDTSTIAPASARDFGKRLAERGIHFLDAPITGGQEGAEKGTLTCMVGGDKEAFEACRAAASTWAANYFHAGPQGAGQAVKACNQVMVTNTMLGIAEAIVLARTQGVDPHLMREILLTGAARSTVLERHTKKLLDESFTPGFRTSLMRKDLRLALATALDAGASLPGTENAEALLDAMCEAGRADWDWCAIALELQRNAGLDTPQSIEP
ncbi:MAG: NAD(P)-dependent oxidoreductase [Burkholderiales bacterium]